MKKFKILMLTVFALLLTACGVKKEAIDDEEFNRIMSNERFTVENREKEFDENEYVEDILLAIQEDNNYEIVFLELESDSYAKKSYELAKKFIEPFKEGTSNYTEVNLANNSKYTLTTEDIYFVIARVEDTIIFLEVDKEYKAEVTDILNKLGY